MQLQMESMAQAEPAAPTLNEPTLNDTVARRLLQQRRVMLTGPIDGPSRSGCARSSW